MIELFKDHFKAIMEGIRHMTASIEQLQATIQALVDTQTKFVNDVSALLSKLPTSPDYSDEVAKLQATIAALQAADNQVVAVTPADTQPAAPATDTPQ